jgi:hypothetical protein
MKISTIILIVVIILVLYYLYLKTEEFTQEESSNSNTNSNSSIEKILSGSFSDITGLFTTDSGKKEKDIETYTPATNTPTDSKLSPVGSSIDTIIDKIIANNYTFALSVTVPMKGVYPADMTNPPEATDVKLYLTVANKNKEYNKCTNLSGMLSLQPTLTKGGAFYLSYEQRSIPKEKYPYKYVDFNSVVHDPTTNTDLLQSVFYGLRLARTLNYVTHCAEGCEDNNGFCAQETLHNRVSTEYPGKDYNDNPRTDLYNIKNLLKFVIEGNSSTSTTVTPYFISLDPDERINFITNMYNTVDDMEAYKKVVQVPIYEKNQRPYYKKPVYVDTNAPSTHEMILNAPSLDITSSNSPSATKFIYENVVIKNLEPILANIDTDMYAKQNVRSIQETQVTKNDAYLDYALKFNVEILTQEQVDALPA